MNSWQRWLRAPHSHWLHRFIFQIHLWMGLTLGLYILVISVSGSAVVLRPQFNQWFIASRVVPLDTGALSSKALDAKLSVVYADYDVLNLSHSTFPSRALFVELTKDGKLYSRFFDQYRGLDLGNSFPWQVSTAEWLVRLHDDLLLGRTGRTINGIGGAILLLMVLSGTIVWWQGTSRWQNGMKITRRSTRSFNWQLHSFVGFWSLFFMFAWGLTAIYFAFPEPFNAVIDYFDDDLTDFDRPDAWLLFLIDLHFGRFGGLWLRCFWVVLGLLPALMYITGFILWWKKLAKRRSV